ncbi:conserved hypothetical protein [Talaromyces marneffei ATCC 18224]|uniref:chitinase n=1 Tax=Talaromyces marneffei (strain ATCC 18224 / CBS 334.59 / QM 7333) TaxID=441960 RepID=B6Q2X2_TALMQ|nr:conserved hypothetical protein [Talaromyces marneffei ATCC 18224]
MVLGAINFVLISSVQAGSWSSGWSALRNSASPSYRGIGDSCPTRCSMSGASYGNWSVYHSLEETRLCEQTVFSLFNIHDTIDDPARQHKIYACSSYGPDWVNMPSQASPAVVVNNTNTTYQLGWWTDGKFQPATIQSLAREMGKYFRNGHGPINQSAILFAQAGGGTAGIYIGKGLQNEGIADFALKNLQDNIQSLNVHSGNVAMQLCGPGYDPDHTFGFIAASNGTFTQVQNAIQAWSKGDCLSFYASQNISGPSYFTTLSRNATIAKNGTISTNSTLNHSARSSHGHSSHSSHRHWARGDCTAIQVKSGDSCASLAAECGISGSDFTNYNSASDLCSSLQPGQHVCCSSGTLPDFAPQPNADGSCATYTVLSGDSCSAIAATYSLTLDKLNDYNKNTWGWGGCNDLLIGNIICLSSGSAPMPAPDANAVCGPTVSGTKAPTDGTAIADLNPCPLNACCNIWGQCGITAEFCTATNSSTGAPGTAAPGTNGCISNCGTDIVKSGAPATYRNVAYYEASNLDRACLYQDILQVDSSLTHLHFAFATLDPTNYAVSVGDVLSSYEFESLKRLSGPLRILTIGGWDFSTSPSTYTIFRNGVTAANRLTMAKNIANFVIDHGLDGVDIDWEYPGAPDIPGIPPASKDDGSNYLNFLVILKNLLGSKSLSIAAPASYWYLKGFPIAQISNIVDYIVFMAYDLHGQWDYGAKSSQEGCPTGNCLRSHVNLTETVSALSMVTKAGVPSNKVVVGVSSYARSFAMAEAGCYTENCFFTGSSSVSNAEPGVCTNTAGYISNAEINEIMGNSSRVTTSYVDESSHSNILVYDGTQWAAYMDDTTKSERVAFYKGLEMGGGTLWASDLSKYNSAPYPSSSWTTFRSNVRIGTDPYAEGSRTGNWTTLTCDDPSVTNLANLTSKERWDQMDCPNAWADAMNVWFNIDKPANSLTFTESISNTLHAPEMADCGDYKATSNCIQTSTCVSIIGNHSGPAAYAIWNSMIVVHEMYITYINALHDAFSDVINPALQNLENTFAPVSPPKSDEWLGILLSIIGLVGTVAGSAFFNSFLSAMPYFKANKALYDNLKDTTKGLVSFGTGLTGTLAKPGSVSAGDWTVQDQAVFSQYMGQSIFAWANLTQVALRNLFNGDQDGLTALTNLISDGKFIEGAVNGAGNYPPTGSGLDNSYAALEASVATSFFAFTIPALWKFSSTYAFVLDSGASCGTTDPLSTYMSSAVMTASGYCFNNNWYYLVYPHEYPSSSCSNTPETPARCDNYMFDAVPGIKSLDGSFGGVTLADLIVGAVNTYVSNGNSNTGTVANPANSGTLDQLYNQNITTPGYITIPVCSPSTAETAVNAKQSNVANYPCNALQAISDCGDSTFVDQTSAASPKVDDCLQIVANIQNTLGEWEVENAVEQQHQLVQYGTCKFGVQGKGINGNIDFHIGAQDIIDIIHSSISKFASNGVVGSMGEMNCNGNVKQQAVEWGLY